MEKIRLSSIQKIYLIFFKELHKFLVDNNIRYYAIGGTALGIKRHKGFIPWDNDMDIAMFRDDYEKFLVLLPKLNTEIFFPIHYSISKPIGHGLIKIGIKGTYNDSNCKKRYDSSFHIDIFPYDNYVYDPKAKNKIIRKRSKYINILYLKQRKKSRNLLRTILLKIIQFFLLPCSSNYIAHKLDLLGKKSNDFEKGKKVTNLMGVYSYEKEAVPISSLGIPTLYKFENIEIYGPENLDLFLTSVYGENYMTPADIRLDKNTYFGYADQGLLDKYNIEYEENI